MTTTARPAPLLLLLALSCAPARGLQSAGSSASREGTVYVEGLTPDNWHNAFDPTSDWQPKIHVPQRAMAVQSIQEHTLLARESARAIGRQMGVPYMPHDFGANLGDGSLEGIRAKTHEHFGEMSKVVPGIAGVTDFLLSRVGNTAKTVDPEEAFQSYSMVAHRLGAKSLANQLAPLLRARTPPNPGSMFNMIGSIMAAHGMPKETIDFYKEMARIYSGAAEPTAAMLQGLQNRTVALNKNRTMPHAMPGAAPAKRLSVPDYYKSTSNAGIVLFQLPCGAGAKVCFALTNEFYSFKSGPGFYSGAFHPPAPGGYAVAMGVATQTPWSFISTPFYLWPNTAVGHEYDLKFAAGQYDLSALTQTTVSSIVKLRESSDCIGTGDGTAINPRVDTCPMACLAVTGGSPQVYSILEILPTRSVDSDALVSFYDIMKYGGPVFGPLTGTIMPDWAWAGFYRQVGAAPGSGARRTGAPGFAR